MAIPGTLTSYDLTAGVIVSMDEVIYLVDPTDSPLIAGTGADGLSVLSTGQAHQKQEQWMDETMLLPASTIAASVTTGTTFLTVAAGDQLKFSTGDVLIVESEYVRVTGYGSTADTLLTTRAYESLSTAVNHATSVAVLCLGTALPEGSDPENARAKDRTTASNFLQIFGPTAISMSMTDTMIRRYGVPDEWAHQLLRRSQENVIRREQAILYGVKNDSTTTRIRVMGGIKQFVTSVIDSSSTSLTPTTLQTNLQTNYNNGGVPDRLIANPSATKNLSDIGNTTIVRVTRDESQRGRPPAAAVQTEFGDVTLVRNRWCRTADAFAIKRDNVTRLILRELRFEMLNKTGDSLKGQIVAEETLKVHGQSQMHLYTALT